MASEEGAVSRSTEEWMSVMDPRKTCAVCGSACRMRCTSCQWAAYCSRECQRRAWKVHKRECQPLDEAFKRGVEAGRKLLEPMFEVKHSTETTTQCWICLEPSGRLFSGGCVCRGGTTCGHVACFVEAAEARHKEDDIWAFDLDKSYYSRCPTCLEYWTGAVKIAMAEALARRYHAAPLTVTRQLESIDEYFEIQQALNILEALLKSISACSNRSVVLQFASLHMRFVWRVEDLFKQGRRTFGEELVSQTKPHRSEEHLVILAQAWAYYKVDALKDTNQTLIGVYRHVVDYAKRVGDGTADDLYIRASHYFGREVLEFAWQARWRSTSDGCDDETLPLLRDAQVEIEAAYRKIEQDPTKQRDKFELLQRKISLRALLGDVDGATAELDDALRDARRVLGQDHVTTRALENAISNYL